MTEFFKSLSAIGDTLQDNRIRNDRASALAAMADSTDPADQAKRAQDAAAMYLASRQAGAWPEAAANAVPQPEPIAPAGPNYRRFSSLPWTR